MRGTATLTRVYRSSQIETIQVITSRAKIPSRYSEKEPHHLSVRSATHMTLYKKTLQKCNSTPLMQDNRTRLYLFGL